jgi:glycosyltransferase involved in cell wall biosynthesis
MKILFAADVPPDPDSGAAGTEYQTILALRRSGHEVDTLWADDLRHRLHHGNLHYLLELPWAYQEAIAERCRRVSFDVIHVNQPYAWKAARDHRRYRRHGLFVNRSHGWEPRVTETLRPWRRKYGVSEWEGMRGVAGRPIRFVLEQLYPRWCVDASDGLIVSCSEDREYLLSRYGLDASRVACIPQAAAEVFTALPPQPMDASRRTRVLYAGQPAFVKAPQVVAQVFSGLAEQDSDLTFTWCCPEASHERFRASLRPVARTRTSFVGWMPQASLASLYDAHGIFLFPSFLEGFGKVFLEAMARGLCVVASRVGGMRDVIRDGINGCCVDPGDVVGFCRSIRHLLASDVMERMSQAAAAEARLYSWARVAGETVAFYQALQVLKRGIGPAGVRHEQE